MGACAQSTDMYLVVLENTVHLPTAAEAAKEEAKPEEEEEDDDLGFSLFD